MDRCKPGGMGCKSHDFTTKEAKKATVLMHTQQYGVKYITMDTKLHYREKKKIAVICNTHLLHESQKHT